MAFLKRKNHEKIIFNLEYSCEHSNENLDFGKNFLTKRILKGIVFEKGVDCKKVVKIFFVILRKRIHNNEADCEQNINANVKNTMLLGPCFCGKT